MKKLQTLAIFCGSSTGKNPHYAEGAQELGSIMAKKNLSLVYGGGGNRGLMGIVAQSLYEKGGKVIGVLPEALNRSDVRLHTVEDELIVVPTMHERKAKMYSLADAFIALPGGESVRLRKSWKSLPGYNWGGTTRSLWLYSTLRDFTINYWIFSPIVSPKDFLSRIIWML